MRIIEDIVSNGHGHLDPAYLFVHSTANPGATAANHRTAAANGNWKYVTQYVCDWTGNVYHLMPDDRLAWAVGNGNRFGVNLEICEGTNQDEFNRAWDTAAEFCAYYLNKRGWSIDRMMSHDECRLRWGGTTHTDPIPYFKRYGRTWEQFKQAVVDRMQNTQKEDELINFSIPEGKYPVYRSYTPGNHLLTSIKSEIDYLVGKGWDDEGVAFYGADTGVPVYRLRANEYFFTTDYSEALKLQAIGWKAENVNFASARPSDPDAVPVHRLYNPNEGTHHWTIDTNERDMLIGKGWILEKGGWYAYPVQ